MLLANYKGSSTINDDQQTDDDPHDDSKKKKRGFRAMNLQNVHQMIFPNWTGKMDFLKAQAQVAAILVIAAIGNLWPVAYKRNDNHNPTMFWVMNAGLLVVSLYTLKHDKEGSARGVQLLSRPQTEEWKGWMQWAFIMVSVMCACARCNGIMVNQAKLCEIKSAERQRDKAYEDGELKESSRTVQLPISLYSCLPPSCVLMADFYLY
jgi:hypothetical protein